MSRGDDDNGYDDHSDDDGSDDSPSASSGSDDSEDETSRSSSDQDDERGRGKGRGRGRGRSDDDLNEIVSSDNSGDDREDYSHRATASSKRDSLTGQDGIGDVFGWSSTGQSRLIRKGSLNFDTITNFESELDAIDAPGDGFKGELTGVSGSLKKLTAGQLQSRFGSRDDLPAGQVISFEVKGFDGRFLLLNDDRDGFQHKSDAVIFLKNVDSSAGITIV